MSQDAGKPGKKSAAEGAAESERIAKRLARAGVASRREAERMIEAGRITLNGEILRTPAVTVTARDLILVDGAPLQEAEPPRLWRFSKPRGVVTTARDEKGRPTIYDALPEGLPRVMPVGRLDIDSEGLLLLTNDGELKRKLELPATAELRRYRVRVHGRPSEEMLRPLIEGATIEGVSYRPMLVAVDRVQGANAWLTVGITEGKNREIRRAMAYVGLTVNRLIRTSYGQFRLGELPAGAVEEVRAKALTALTGVATETPAARERRARDGGAKRGKPNPGARPPRAR